jgi:uncharacterized membrane protein YccC
MTDSTKAAAGPGWLRARWSPARRPDVPGATRPAWLPVWSVPAALRAIRATIVMPSLFALTFEVIGNPQMTLFAVFGSFATLVMASFGGTRRDKAVAHLGLAVVGSIALVIGTLVSGIAWLATLVTIPVTFAIFFAGVAGPNMASGITAALLAYVLPVAALAEPGTIPARLAGWWLASIVGTAAVLLLSPRPPGDKLRATTASAAATLARHINAALDGTATPADRESSLAARQELKVAFVAGPSRPTGLAAPDQALANVVELLQWCAELITDTLDGHVDLARAGPADLGLLRSSAGLLADIAAVLSGAAGQPDLAQLETAIEAGATGQQELADDPDELRARAAVAAHAQAIAVAVRATAADALIAARRASPELVAAERRRWYGLQEGSALSHAPALAGIAEFVAGQASTRSVWFRNSARGSIALALAVAVAYATGVQHGFWVILGTLSVLRTTAASTGATAWRALAGTVAGFAVGALLLLAIGTGPTALWIALPFAVFVAAYAPGTTPFVVGQAAFTVTVLVIFNLLVPAGWKVGLLRVEDVALGCAVSVVIGVLFWPRGASALVGDDLADAFRRGATYLTQAVDWALGARQTPPDSAVAAVAASSRVDEALRAFLTEQGTKRLTNDDLWSLVIASTQLRLTAYSVASLPASQPAAADGLPGRGGDEPPGHSGNGGPDPRARTRDTRSAEAGDGASEAVAAFRHETAELAAFYDQVAVQVGPPRRQPAAPVTVPDLTGPGFPRGVACARNTPPDYRPGMLWVGEYLYHLAGNAEAITGPAKKVALARQRPWWR